jgi:hypothetical protein
MSGDPSPFAVSNDHYGWLTMPGRMNVDNDGFLVGDQSSHFNFKAPPPVVAVPKFFDGCSSREQAIARMIEELGVPLSIERDGHDAIYRRLADALILVLAIQGDLTP